MTIIGEKVPLDVLIYATGFITVCTVFRQAIDILTSASVDQDNYPLDVRGTRGTLNDYNDAHGGPTAYLGSTVPGFPNFFMILGTARLVYAKQGQKSFAYDMVCSARYRSKYGHRPHVRHFLRRIAGHISTATARARTRRSAHERGADGRSDGPVQRRATRTAQRLGLVAVRVVVPRRWERTHRLHVPRAARAALVVAPKAALGGPRDRGSWCGGVAPTPCAMVVEVVVRDGDSGLRVRSAPVSPVRCPSLEGRIGLVEQRVRIWFASLRAFMSSC